MLWIFSQDRAFGRQTVSDADGNPYRVERQWGNRWLDDRRLIFWDLDRSRAVLWDVEKREATAVPGMGDEPAEFVFSADGRLVYRLQRRLDSDIWLLELEK